jgi:hypothetical protein
LRALDSCHGYVDGRNHGLGYVRFPEVNEWAAALAAGRDPAMYRFSACRAAARRGDGDQPHRDWPEERAEYEPDPRVTRALRSEPGGERREDTGDEQQG